MRRRDCDFIPAVFLAAAVALAAGCSRNTTTLDRIEERDPLLKRAQVLKSVQDIDGAIEACTKALDRKPTLARAHLELGLMYDANKQDYVRAIYHYQRYLELRPQAEKKKLIEDLIRQAKLSYAASLPHQPGGAVEQIAVLKREIEMLKSELERQKGGGAAPPPKAKTSKSKSAEPEPAAKSDLKPEPAKPAVQTYVVQNGDTLSRIAEKMYNDRNKWKAIYDANRGALASPESVKTGQTLIIPK
jgi:tetratricopeptide (TPR) repeat protein